MNNHLTLVYFSPTGTTKTVLEAVAEGLGREVTTVIDLTRPETRSRQTIPLPEGPVLLGAPVYGGRIPRDAALCFEKLAANGNPVVLVVVYGNRAYEDALLELKDIASDKGLYPVAAAAFIGEHSFSGPRYAIASGRPDEDDISKAGSFGRKAAELILRQPSAPVDVPGSFPYKERKAATPAAFIEVTEDCNDCGTCAQVCPQNAIIDDTRMTIEENCILCCACIKSCPSGARIMKEGRVMEMAKWLFDNCSEPKAPELFFAEA